MQQYKTVWIIGANSDVARELMKKMNGQYQIVAASRNLKNLKKFIQDNKLENTTAVELDVCEKEQICSFLNSYKTPDIIIFSQGILKTGDNVFDYMDEMIECNYVVCVRIIESIWQDMLREKKGCIVGITSVAADRGKMSNKLYSSTKAALSSYLQALMQEGQKRGVQVIEIKPGYIKTKMLESSQKAYNSILAEEPSKTAINIIRKIESGQSGTVYTRKIWRLIMYMIKMIPEKMYIKLKM